MRRHAGFLLLCFILSVLGGCMDRVMSFLTHPPSAVRLTQPNVTVASLREAKLAMLGLKPISEETPQALITVERDLSRPQFMKARFALSIPAPQPRGFATQALPTNTINFVKIAVAGIGIVTPLFADGADAAGLVPNIGVNYTLTVSNIPYGNSRFVTLTVFDAAKVAIPGGIAKAAFHVNAPVTNLELSYRSTPTAQVVENMLGTTPNDHTVSQLNLSALQTFVDTLTGVTGTAPNYAYSTHPALIVAAPIATDLLAANGNVASLNAANPAYKSSAGIVQVTVTGLIGPDTALITVTDPWSVASVPVGNGGPYNIPNVLPGNWKVNVTATGYVADTVPSVTMTAGGTVNVGTVNLSVAAIPNITSLSVANGLIGSALTINGTNFHATPAGNTVKFGTAVTTVTTASTTALTVPVPAGIWGNQNVTVTVGGQTSNTAAFVVKPDLTSLSPAAKAVGTAININGSGFDALVPANNTVSFNGINATVNTASNSLLNVTVPNATNGNVTVQVGAQTSNGLAFNVLPTILITAPAAGLVNGTIPFTAAVTAGNPVTQVEFFDGATSLGVDTTAPYSINWNTTLVAIGAHTLTAKVTDGVGNQVTSTAVNVTVNQPPVIVSLVPSQNPVSGLGYPIRLTVTATDADTTLTDTAYTWSCDGGCGSFNRTDSPQVVWTSPTSAGGPYTLRVAVNDGVNPAVQSTVSITVNNLNANVNFNGGQN